MLMLHSRVVETSVNGKRKSEQPASRSVEGDIGCAIGMIRCKRSSFSLLSDYERSWRMTMTDGANDRVGHSVQRLRVSLSM